jgi:starch-binding outer membrane protein, SusD/RagB family
METLKYKRPRATALALLLFCIIPLFVASCKKYITVDTPSTSIGTEAAFQSNTSAAQVLNGIYSEMALTIQNGTLVSTCILPELTADNLTLYNPDGSFGYIDYYRNSLESNYSSSSQEGTYWTRCYGLLFTVNTAIDKLTDNKHLSPSVAQRLLGEAYFIRAFLYFYLANFYGEVPLVLSTNYQENGALGKSTSAQIYTQMITDLTSAESLLDHTFMNGDISSTTLDRLRPNLAAVNALQARVYLYQKRYSDAETAATKVISQPRFSLADLDQVFLKNSSETIWGLQPVTIGFNTALAVFFLIPSQGPSEYANPVYASKSLVESFAAGDRRKEKWLGIVNVEGTDYFYPTKYKRGFVSDSKQIDEYTIVLRLAEVYLIRAEARNEQGNSSGAVEDLNAIRERSRADVSVEIPDPLPVLTSTLTDAELKPIILHERRVELFTEWGHRWFDLRRSGFLDAVMTEEEVIKGGSWDPYKAYYPIPQQDLDTNLELKQTPGYTN